MNHCKDGRGHLGGVPSKLCRVSDGAAEISRCEYLWHELSASFSLSGIIAMLVQEG